MMVGDAAVEALRRRLLMSWSTLKSCGIIVASGLLSYRQRRGELVVSQS